MARYTEQDRTTIDATVDRWREDCLIHDGCSYIRMSLTSRGSRAYAAGAGVA